MRRRDLLLAGAAVLAAATARGQAGAFDHGHTAWTALLARHVKLAPDGKVRICKACRIFESLAKHQELTKEVIWQNLLRRKAD